MSIHWYHPSAMTGFWLCGLAFSLGHHAYYASLDGKLARDQEWVIRYGTGFSFLVKACYAASLGIAIKQLVWALVRHAAASIRAIDAFFSITTDVTSLFVGELWRRTPNLAIVAVFFWLIPLAAVVTPSSISVSTTEIISTRHCDIPVLDFDKKFDWEYKSPQSALANFNETQEIDPDFPGGDERPWKTHVPVARAYARPSPFAERLLRRVLIGGQILDTPSICGPNCTFNATVPGIGYHCPVVDPRSDEARFVNDTMGAYVYHARLLKSRRILGLVIQQEQREEDRDPEFSMEYFVCEPKRVMYDVQFSFVNNIRTIRFGKKEVVGPIRWPTFRFNDTLKASYAQTNFWAYQALADLLGRSFRGSMRMPQGGDTTSSTILSYTSLVGHQRQQGNLNATVLEALYWPKPEFRAKLVELVRNVSISLLAEPSVHVFSTVVGECRVSDSGGNWMYDPRPLWIAYGTLCLFGIAGLWVGALSISFNGCTSDMSFSKILCTTRNGYLDQAVAGSRFGAHPLVKQLQDIRLQFGELSDEKHAGFGSEEQITSFEKGKCEQGLA
ncbi:hypothetical protein B0T10DRAFT_563104 [Thelonectria olida]|uniref:Uncharacterized protein n=1 Tax=Thelonectria olida TaxID=1576542 RepID=A0A9P8W0F6_9HYPO|nr:hypothetical protein B0T10DRAFT_563104 [Thelonectria olida]